MRVDIASNSTHELLTGQTPPASPKANQLDEKTVRGPMYFINRDFHLCDETYNVLHHFHSWKTETRHTVLSLSTRLTDQQQSHLKICEEEGDTAAEQVKKLNLAPWNVVGIRANYYDRQFAVDEHERLEFASVIDFDIHAIGDFERGTMDSSPHAKLRVQFNGCVSASQRAAQQTSIEYELILGIPMADTPVSYPIRCRNSKSKAWMYSCDLFEIEVTPSRFFLMETRIILADSIKDGSSEAACLLMGAFTILYAHPDRLMREFVIREYDKWKLLNYQIPTQPSSVSGGGSCEDSPSFSDTSTAESSGGSIGTLRVRDDSTGS